MTTKCKKKLVKKVAFSSKNITTYGGIYLFKQFMDKIDFKGMIDKQLYFNDLGGWYRPDQLIFQFIAGIILGLYRLSQWQLLSKDTVIGHIFGMVFCNYSTLSRFFHKSEQSFCTALDQINCLLLRNRFPKDLTKITLDIDSSVVTVYGNQEDAEYGYNPTHKGKKSYHPLFCFIGETKEYVLGKLRPGSVYSNEGIIGFMEEVMRILPESVHHITVRADSGFFDDKLLRYLEKHHIQYVIKSKMYSALRRGITDITNFRHITDTECVGEMVYKLGQWKQSRRFIVHRKTVTRKESNTGHLFPDEPCYVYAFIVTNLPDTSETILSYYKQRGTMENYIKEAKLGFHFGSILTDSFWANSALLILTMIAYNIFLQFKQLALKGHAQRWNIETCRTQLFYLAGQLCSSGRKLVLKFARGFPNKQRYYDTMRLIASI